MLHFKVNPNKTKDDKSMSVLVRLPHIGKSKRKKIDLDTTPKDLVRELTSEQDQEKYGLYYVTNEDGYDDEGLVLEKDKPVVLAGIKDGVRAHYTVPLHTKLQTTQPRNHTTTQPHNHITTQPHNYTTAQSHQRISHLRLPLIMPHQPFSFPNTITNSLDQGHPRVTVANQSHIQQQQWHCHESYGVW